MQEVQREVAQMRTVLSSPLLPHLLRLKEAYLSPSSSSSRAKHTSATVVSCFTSTTTFISYRYKNRAHINNTNTHLVSTAIQYLEQSPALSVSTSACSGHSKTEAMLHRCILLSREGVVVVVAFPILGVCPHPPGVWRREKMQLFGISKHLESTHHTIHHSLLTTYHTRKDGGGRLTASCHQSRLIFRLARGLLGRLVSSPATPDDPPSCWLPNSSRTKLKRERKSRHTAYHPEGWDGKILTIQGMTCNAKHGTK
ncbi:hypothetical protein E2C01_006588 [Portunus trituberculatus]|uniref:Uncharacterized protein n=1 Tax=Portunus trituberculatus TaxID=210409 RepID=A0A5B7CWR6_PORTR|nr:hypothetical protein [Portunus trituberculatus]